MPVDEPAVVTIQQAVVLVASPTVMELAKLHGVEELLALRRYGALPQSAA